MAIGTKLVWKTGRIHSIVPFTARDQSRYVRVNVDIFDGNNTITASQVCRPELTVGGRLYSWLRVCGVPLAEVDDMLPIGRMIGKSVSVIVEQNGEYFNITKLKTTVEAK